MFGKHARCIELGRSMWATPPLGEGEATEAQEEDFHRGQYPSAQEAFKAAQTATTEDIERPKPYAGATQPCTYGVTRAQRGEMQTWVNRLKP